MSYSIFKALHIVFMVSWFAGLFYMVRLFIYHTEADSKDEPERGILIRQFAIMEKKLWWIITTPAMALTVLFGLLMLGANPGLLGSLYMIIKLGFVGLLLVYHFISQKIYNDLGRGKFLWSSSALRVWNEVATLLLVIIVFVIVLKSATNWIYASIGFFAVGLLLLLAIRMYESLRNKDQAMQRIKKEKLHDKNGHDVSA
ncbi:MAG: CopD family protein [Flavobacteriales bacterium]